MKLDRKKLSWIAATIALFFFIVAQLLDPPEPVELPPLTLEDRDAGVNDAAPIEEEEEEEPTDPDNRDAWIEAIESLVLDHLSSVTRSIDYSARLEAGLQAAPFMVDYSLAAAIDPVLSFAVSKRESSLRMNAKGKKGEIGLFQTMPGRRLVSRDWSSQEGQIAEGIARLRESFDTCEGMTLRNVLAHYSSGSCYKGFGAADRKLAAYEAARAALLERKVAVVLEVKNRWK